MKTTLIATAAFLALTGCNNGGAAGGTSMLTRITDVTSDAKCPSGGLKIATGTDADGNNTLEDSEVTQSSQICNGANGADGMNGGNGNNGSDGDAGANGMNGTNGAASLINTTILPTGNGQCRSGGAQVDFGLDDGAGGGTAGNGTLEPGEIRSTRFICNGSTPYYPGSTTAPGGATGVYRLRSSGGAGSNTGGDAAAIVINHHTSGTLGGNVKVFRTGAIDGGFSMPTLPTFDPGPAPMLINADFTLGRFASIDAGVASADPYFQVNVSGLEQNVYAKDGGIAVQVSSLSVAAGRVLTIVGDGTTGTINVERDIRNAGTITAGAGRGGSKNLTLISNTFVGLSGSVVHTDGLAALVGDPGGTAGTLSVTTNGRLISLGNFSAVGTSGDAGGGDGSAIALTSNGSDCHLTGTIVTTGGGGTAGVGGAGGPVTISCRAIFNSAFINTQGGIAQGANAGGAVSLQTALGPLRNNGPIITRGASCTTQVRCSGGPGAAISLSSRGGDLTTSGALITSGGAGELAGGAAAAITIRATTGTHISVVPAGSVRVSGDVLAEGGAGTTGGAAGPITIQVDPGASPLGQEVELQGYSELDASGGVGTGITGGNGTSITISTVTTLVNDTRQPSGAVINTAKLSAHGGDGASAGTSGFVSLQTQLTDFGQANEFVSNTGIIDVSAGNSGSTSGRQGGLISLFGVSRADNRGELIANGGSSSGGPLSGGAGGLVAIRGGVGALTNSGAISVNGGSSSGNGGVGGRAWLNAFGISNSAAINARGGNGTNVGGNGGDITLTATFGHSTDNVGVLTVTGGNGSIAGLRGNTFVDGAETF